MYPHGLLRRLVQVSRRGMQAHLKNKQRVAGEGDEGLIMAEPFYALTS
jgi:hypothetical protein